MIYTRFDIPNEFSINRIFYATIYTNKSYKETEIELDENDERIIRIGCTCAANIFKVGQNKDQIRCKHIRNFEDKIKSMGYLK